jgi:hypothetical protein
MGATYKNLLTTVIIVGIITAGMAGLLTELTTNYNQPISNETSNTLENITGSLDTMQSFSDSFQSGAEGAESSALDSLTTMWAVIKLPFTTLSTIRSLITEVTVILGLPDWFTYSIIAIIVIVLSSIAIAILTRRVET